MKELEHSERLKIDAEIKAKREVQKREAEWRHKQAELSAKRRAEQHEVELKQKLEADRRQRESDEVRSKVEA